MLQYDNSAFYFFLLSIISFYLVPSWYFIISRTVSTLTAKEEVTPRTSAERKKAEALKKQQKASLLSNKTFLYNLIATVILTIVFFALLYTVATADSDISSFDPFTILEIDHNADNKTIKKAYRKLSLQYHPDKNPNNRMAETKFMMISKAYEALTDETAKENYQKYGNPDGKQSLQVSIGLPSFLLEGNNRNLVLIFYLIVMVGLVPLAVYTYYSNSSKYGEKNVMYDTYAWYHHTLNEHTIVKALPEILAGSAEFRENGTVNDQEKQEIGSALTKMRNNMAKPKYNHPVCVKGNVLLHAHLMRRASELIDNKALKKDLNNMLEHSTKLIDAMIAVCTHQDCIQTAMHCIEFGQYITQAIWVKDSPLLQLPHYSDNEAKKVPNMSIQQFKETPADQRKGIANMTDEQKKDIEEYLKIFPDITVEAKVFVDDDEDDKVYEGDLVTVQVKITRNNDAPAGLVHSPHFPFYKKEAWWIILGQLSPQGKMISIEKKKANSRSNTITHNIKFMAPPRGSYEFDLFVKSNGYVGCDYSTKVTMETLDKSSLPEYKVHPDDAVLDDEPTLWEEMLNANIDKDDSDDEDDDSDDEVDDKDGNKEKSEAAKKREQLRKARQGDDSDSDNDEAEEVYADNFTMTNAVLGGDNAAAIEPRALLRKVMAIALVTTQVLPKMLNQVVTNDDTTILFFVAYMLMIMTMMAALTSLTLRLTRPRHCQKSKQGSRLLAYAFIVSFTTVILMTRRLVAC